MLKLKCYIYSKTKQVYIYVFLYLNLNKKNRIPKYIINMFIICKVKSHVILKCILTAIFLCPQFTDVSLKYYSNYFKFPYNIE